jgi:thiamine-phosphate pyrophosphorylase
MKKLSEQAIRESMLLYAVTDRTWLKEGETLAQVTQKVLEHGATFLQIREKELSHDAFLAEAKLLKELAGRYRVPFVVNDDIDIALACDADGVHVGQSDIVGKDVRAMIGPDKILGISANTVETAKAAQAAGADYIGVGAVFTTTTKADAKNLTVEALREIVSAVEIPVVAIGGISADNLLQLKGSGVDGVAVVSALFGQKDPGAAAARLLELCRELVAHG